MFCSISSLIKRAKSSLVRRKLRHRKDQENRPTLKGDQHVSIAASSSSIQIQLPRSQPLSLDRLERTRILEEIFDNCEHYAAEFHDIDYNALKNEVIVPVLKCEYAPEVQLRGFLKTFHKTSAYQTAFYHLPNELIKKQIDEFISGRDDAGSIGNECFNILTHPSPPAQHHFSLIGTLRGLFADTVELRAAVENIDHPMHANVASLPILWDDTTGNKLVEVYGQVPFTNWGQTVRNTPKFTFLPSTVAGVQNIIRYAVRHNLRVRCAGYRHSWSPIFSEDNEILISLVNLHQVTQLPDPLSTESWKAETGELRSIELQDETVPGKKRLCRVGAGATTEEFRQWSVTNDAWALPVDVILVEVTIGGANSAICHGAGRRHKTISDCVRRIEFVDCRGELRTVDDPVLIKAAAGAFGLLGVVTHVTFELDAMTYAVLQPRKEDVGLAVPPLQKSDIPVALRESWYDQPSAEDRLEKARTEFERSAADDYYCEWFWFPYQRKVWVNTWDTVQDGTGKIDYPSQAQTFLQWVENWLGGVMSSHPFFQALPGYWQAQLLATMSMAFLPPEFSETKRPIVKTHVTNGLHFRRGIQNMRVRNMELQIPLPPYEKDVTKPDFSVARRAWWDIIRLIYEDAAQTGDMSSPLRLAMEMRIMGGSDMLMAPQYGNSLGTCSIEVLSLPDAVEDHEWQDFLQKVANIWMSYGNQLNVRPHWAKEWDGLKFKGIDARAYLKSVAYAEQIPQFKICLDNIGQLNGGWGLTELKARFSNELWDYIIYD